MFALAPSRRRRGGTHTAAPPPLPQLPLPPLLSAPPPPPQLPLPPLLPPPPPLLLSPPPLMSGSAAGQLGSPASSQGPPEPDDDDPDFVHSYVPDFTVERYGPRLRLHVHSDELQHTLRAAGLRCADLEDVASGMASWRECRRAARALLARCRPTRAALDCLLDAVLGIDEAGLLPHLQQAPLRTLRLYDLEHTHLLRPPWESWTPYAELRAVVALVSLPRLCLAPPPPRQTPTRWRRRCLVRAFWQTWAQALAAVRPRARCCGPMSPATASSSSRAV